MKSYQFNKQYVHELAESFLDIADQCGRDIGLLRGRLIAIPKGIQKAM